MNILWFTWKDRKNPAAGGAELLNDELAKRLVQDGHAVTLIVANFQGSRTKELINGYTIIRVGNRWTVYWEAYKYYKKHLKNWPDLIIEELNTVPFFTQFYTGQTKRVLVIYQLCREIWFHEMFFPLNVVGYLIEPLYLWLLRKNTVITESRSTAHELEKYGFRRRNIHIIPVAVDMKPVQSSAQKHKYKDFTLLSLGAIRSMKQTHHQLEAFELVKKEIPRLQFIVAGAPVGAYGRRFLARLNRSPYAADIHYLGRVSDQKKRELLQKCHLILVTSVKEGWGLIVTEAASQGTPAVVYNRDGLRDSIRTKVSGLICQENTPAIIAQNIIKLARKRALYMKLQKGAIEYSREFNFQKTYIRFRESIRL